MKLVASVALALLLSLTLHPSSAQATLPQPDAPRAAGQDNTAPRVAASWQCARTKDSGTHLTQWCVKFTKIKPIIKDRSHAYAFNKFKRKRPVTCSVSHSTTWSFHASGTVEAEAGVIFAKASASATAGGSYSSSTSTGWSATFPVKGKGVGYCAWGHAGFKLSGVTKKVGCNASKCMVMERNKFSGVSMPSAPFFEFGPGRKINWKSFLPAV